MRSFSELDLLTIMDGIGDLADNERHIGRMVDLVQAYRSRSPESSAKIDELLLEEVARLRKGLESSRQAQEKVKSLLEKLTLPPWHQGLFLEPVETKQGQMALVALSNNRRVVGPGDVDIGKLSVGDVVFLNNEMNVLMARSSTPLSRGGETASFVRLTDDGRMVVRCRDEEILVEKAHRLTGMELKKGDEVLWDRNAWIAMEKIPRAPDSSYFLEKTPSETFSQVGGLDRQIRSVTSSIRLHFKEQDRVRKYQLRPRGSVLLVGPPGNGKTLVAKALANWLRELSPCDKVRFIHIPPAGLHTSWYGETERNYRHVFSTGREFANREPDVPVVLFFDEIDAVGVSRGSSYHHIDDRVQTAFMSELDGLEARGNILVLAATNRRDALDPALLRPGRLSDLVVEIPRPNREAAREILSKHLPEAIPYATNGSGTKTGGFRADLIDSIVSRLYVPNGEGNLAELTFRDNTRRPVRAVDLINGATLANIAHKGIERACFREAEGGASGLCLEDLLAAVHEELQTLVSALTRVNCRNFIEDLPQDIDVVKVEPVTPAVQRAYRYLRLA